MWNAWLQRHVAVDEETRRAGWERSDRAERLRRDHKLRREALDVAIAMWPDASSEQLITNTERIRKYLAGETP
jgi:hypothetical protein